MANKTQNVAATAVSSSQINVSWDDVATLTGEVYDVERNGVIVGNDYAGTHTPGSPYQDTGLSPGTAYTYRVRAVNGTEPGPPVTPTTAWYDFSDGASLFEDTARTDPVDIDGDVIKGVTDKSGNGKHLTEATNGPTYKVNIVNARSVARFDGTNDLLQNTAMTADTSQTIFIVALRQSAPTAATDTIFGIGDSGCQIYTDSDTHATGWNYFSSAPTGTNFAGPSTSVMALALRVNSNSSLDLYGNGGTATSVDPNDVITTGTTYSYGVDVGGSQFADYDLCEVIIYNTALSSTDLNLVGNYLERWSLTWTDV